MAHLMNLTDKQWYNFICGMQAGLKLRDLTLPAYDTNVVLTPIGIGGYGQIGIMIPQMLYNGSSQEGYIPVCTHDVDKSYSGFSVRINFDSDRLQLLGITDGEFGIVGDDILYSYSDGNLLVQGLLDGLLSQLPAVAQGLTVMPSEYNTPKILFYMHVKVLSEVTKENPIALNINSGTGADVNYTTLMTFVLNSSNNKYYLYYITPLTNVSGAIVSEKESNKAQVGDDKVISAPSSPSGIYIGTSYTAPGEQGVVPIVASSSISDNFPFNGIHSVVVVEDKDVIFSYLNVSGSGDWSLSASISYNSSGYLVLDITGSRLSAKSDSVTVGYIEYAIGNKDDSYVIPLNNILSELLN